MNTVKAPLLSRREQAVILRDTMFERMTECGVSNSVAALMLGVSLNTLFCWSIGYKGKPTSPSGDLFDSVRIFIRRMEAAYKAGLLPLRGIPEAPRDREGRSEVVKILLNADIE